MIRSVIVITCFIAVLTLDAAAMELGKWISFTGGNHPAPAEIEVVEQDSDSILVDMMLDGVNVQEREERDRKFQFLSIPQADWTNETGKPKLPVIRTLLMIPSDLGFSESEETSNDMQIQIEDEAYTILKDYNVYPVGREVVSRSRGSAVFIDEEFAFDENKGFADDKNY